MCGAAWPKVVRHFLFALGGFCTACALNVTQPPNGGQITGSPFPAVVDWSGTLDGSTFRASLDGSDVSSQFTLAGGPPAHANLSLDPSATTGSSHTLTAQGGICSLLTLCIGRQTVSASSSFTLGAPPPPPPPPPPPAPDFSLSANPTAAVVPWGAAATSQISAQGLNNFNQQIALSTSGGPSGGPVSVTPGTIAVGQNATLTVSTTLAATALGTSTATVTGASPPVSSHSAIINLTVLPQAGAFTEVSPVVSSTQLSSCGSNVSASYDTANKTVTFQVGSQSTGALQAPYFAISPAPCRVGLIMNKLNTQDVVEFFNLGFLPAAQPIAAIPHQIGLNLQNSSWRRFYFSPDSSIMYSVARLSGTPGTPGQHVGNLRNVLSGHDVQCGWQFIPGFTTDHATEDSTDFLPDIINVVLGPSARDPTKQEVTVTYRDAAMAVHTINPACPAP